MEYERLAKHVLVHNADIRQVIAAAPTTPHGYTPRKACEWINGDMALQLGYTGLTADHLQGRIANSKLLFLGLYHHTSIVHLSLEGLTHWLWAYPCTIFCMARWALRFVPSYVALWERCLAYLLFYNYDVRYPQYFAAFMQMTDNAIANVRDPVYRVMHANFLWPTTPNACEAALYTAASANATELFGSIWLRMGVAQNMLLVLNIIRQYPKISGALDVLSVSDQRYAIPQLVQTVSTYKMFFSINVQHWSVQLLSYCLLYCNPTTEWICELVRTCMWSPDDSSSQCQVFFDILLPYLAFTELDCATPKWPKFDNPQTVRLFVVEHNIRILRGCYVFSREMLALVQEYHIQGTIFPPTLRAVKELDREDFTKLLQYITHDWLSWNFYGHFPIWMLEVLRNHFQLPQGSWVVNNLLLTPQVYQWQLEMLQQPITARQVVRTLEASTQYISAEFAETMVAPFRATDATAYHRICMARSVWVELYPHVFSRRVANLIYDCAYLSDLYPMFLANENVLRLFLSTSRRWFSLLRLPLPVQYLELVMQMHQCTWDALIISVAAWPIETRGYKHKALVYLAERYAQNPVPLHVSSLWLLFQLHPRVFSMFLTPTQETLIAMRAFVPRPELLFSLEMAFPSSRKVQ